MYHPEQENNPEWNNHHYWNNPAMGYDYGGYVHPHMGQIQGQQQVNYGLYGQNQNNENHWNNRKYTLDYKAEREDNKNGNEEPTWNNTTKSSPEQEQQSSSRRTSNDSGIPEYRPNVPQNGKFVI